MNDNYSCTKGFFNFILIFNICIICYLNLVTNINSPKAKEITSVNISYASAGSRPSREDSRCLQDSSFMTFFFFK